MPIYSCMTLELGETKAGKLLPIAFPRTRQDLEIPSLTLSLIPVTWPVYSLEMGPINLQVIPLSPLLVSASPAGMLTGGLSWFRVVFSGRAELSLCNRFSKQWVTG